MPAETDLVLVGAGHAHLHLLEQAARLRRAGYRTTVVAPRWFDYSGSASAVVAGGRDPGSARVDVAALAQRGGVTHLETTVLDVDLAARRVTTADGRSLVGDVLSFNIGSEARVPLAIAAVPGVGDDLVRVKPLTDLARLSDRLQQRPPGRGHHITVVGAGPSGLELAGHLAARADTDRVTLIEAGPRIGGFLPPRASRRVCRLLRDRGVDLRVGTAVHELVEDAVVLADGTRIPHDTVVLATGLQAASLARSVIGGGPGGFPVRATLQHRDHDDVYAAGDCAHFLPGALPRVGVHGVRQGPVLLEALESRARGRQGPVYTPPRQTLAILDLGAGRAVAVRGDRWWLGRSSLVLKRVIDRRWLSTYRT